MGKIFEKYFHYDDIFLEIKWIGGWKGAVTVPFQEIFSAESPMIISPYVTACLSGAESLNFPPR